MAFSLFLAGNILGKSRADYKCNEVVNYVLNGNKAGIRAADYLRWGREVKTPSAGTIVVGKDGVHVGVFISSTEFIHSSSKQYKVIKAPLSQLPYVFPLGYVYRKN